MPINIRAAQEQRKMRKERGEEEQRSYFISSTITKGKFATL
jgi:hypothetical protein